MQKIAGPVLHGLINMQGARVEGAAPNLVAEACSPLLVEIMMGDACLTCSAFPHEIHAYFTWRHLNCCPAVVTGVLPAGSTALMKLIGQFQPYFWMNLMELGGS